MHSSLSASSIVCPQETVGLVIRPETLAPIIERLSTPIEVTAQCVTRASPDNGVVPRLTCSQGGVWGFRLHL